MSDGFKQVGKLFIPEIRVEETPKTPSAPLAKSDQMTCCPRCPNHGECLRKFKRSKANPRFDHRTKSGKGANLNQEIMANQDWSACKEKEDVEHKVQDVKPPEWIAGSEPGAGSQEPENR